MSKTLISVAAGVATMISVFAMLAVMSLVAAATAIALLPFLYELRQRIKAEQAGKSKNEPGTLDITPWHIKLRNKLQRKYSDLW